MFQPDKELTLPEIIHYHPCLPKWLRRIERAEKRGYFTTYETDLAANWNSCAVGEARRRYKMIGYRYATLPVDKTLCKLGVIFSEKGVNVNDFAHCRYILNLIEQRLGELNVWPSQS